MKPKDLPFYDVATASTIQETTPVNKNPQPNILENRIKNVRMYVDDSTKPLQSSWNKSYGKVKDTVARAKDKYSKVYHPRMYQNAAIIGGSTAVGVVAQQFVFHRSAYIRRLLTPLVFGTAAAIFVYPEKVSSLGKNIYKSGSEKFVDVKKRVNGKE